MRRSFPWLGLGCLAGYLAGVLLWGGLLVAGIGMVFAPRRPQWWFEATRSLLTEAEYGYEFVLLSAHLWGSVGAIAVYSAARRRFFFVTTASLIFATVCVALLLASVHWVGSEVLGVFTSRRPWARRLFNEGVNRAALLAIPTAFLAGVSWWKWRARRGRRREGV